MPVGPAGYVAVVGDARLQSPRTESAAGIHVETRVELEDAKFSDFSPALATD